MGNRVWYEWDLETVYRESGDVLDHHFADRLQELPARESDQDLVLVRSVGNEHDGVADKMWAYVVNGELPKTFSVPTECGMSDCGVKVPKRFAVEFSLHNKI